MSQSREDRLFCVSENEEGERKLHTVSEEVICQKGPRERIYSSVISCALNIEPDLAAALSFALLAGFTVFPVCLLPRMR